MPDEKLTTFLNVVRCGSLTQAARELHISQPALTLQIHKLEQEYGEPLFYRQDRGVTLTPAGKLFHDYATRINRLYSEVTEELNALNGELRGTLHIGATLTIGEYLLPEIVGCFKTEHPYVNILLEVENTRKIVDMVASGMLDCGLVEGPFDNGMIRTEKLADDELAFICSSRHELASNSELDLDTFQRQNFILREPGSGTRQVFEDALRQAVIDPSGLKILMQLGSTQMIKALVAENVGVSVISERTVRQELQQGLLKKIKVPALDLHRAFQFIFKKDMRLSYITRQFVTTCRNLVEKGS